MQLKKKKDMSFNIYKGHYVLCTISKQRPAPKHTTLNYLDIGDKE